MKMNQMEPGLSDNESRDVQRQQGGPKNVNVTVVMDTNTLRYIRKQKVPKLQRLPRLGILESEYPPPHRGHGLVLVIQVKYIMALVLWRLVTTCRAGPGTRLLCCSSHHSGCSRLWPLNPARSVHTQVLLRYVLGRL